ncbi:DoxX family membrane protein [Nocardioides campestrisoli]|uniref:DoxX family membrane protein n=1 Tax=Nocardioides campestrisoli TaxID=2736757 RepID=UPI0015E67AFF|nr:DoxX family membrane protein [Nocardioides campestrisoli]
MHLTQVPLRVATGAYILNSGLGKLNADEGTAQYLHGAAAGAYPAAVKDMDPKGFTNLLAYGEIAVGAALLAPMVPATVAGAALTGFGSALVGMYLRTPGMTLDDGIRPSQEGTAVAKDVWLVGAGLTLFTQGLTGMAKSGVKRSKKAVKKANPLT